jgi:hypothetical protein
VSAVALSPAGALAWLRSLSIDLRATVVLDAAGTVLAGDAALGARAAAALAGAPAHEDPAAAVRDGDLPAVRDGDLLAVRAGRHTVAAALGPLALERLARCDLEAAAEALEST